MLDFTIGLLAQSGDINYFDMLVYPGGGLIGILLWLLSIVLVALCIQFFVQIREANIMPEVVKSQIQTMFENKQYREAIEVTATEPSMLSFVIHAALGQAAHGYAYMEKALEESVQEKAAVMLRKIEWLNLLGNISPMLGLLGTVWGMILAFMAIVAAKGIPSPDKLAFSIGIALVTTLLGLMVAIPALACFAILRNRIDALSTQVIMHGQELISTFRPAPKA